MIVKKLHNRGTLVMVVLGALLFLPGLGLAPLFDWDEINFAEAAREMLLSGDWLRMQIDFKPFWEKPPLFIWLQALSMWLLGVGEYAARLPNALAGIATLVVVYNMGSLIFNRRFGLFWALSYTAALFPHLYFKSGIIDPVFNLFIFLSYWYFILHYWKLKQYPQPRLRHHRLVYLALSGAFAGLAVLTKGQVALVILGMGIGTFWLMRNQKLALWLQQGRLNLLLRYDFRQLRGFIPPWHLAVAGLACVVVLLGWYGLEILNNGWWFVREFMVYQVRLLSTEDAGHGGFPGYHFVMVFFLCFPASILALRSFGCHCAAEVHQRTFKKWMLILFWVVLILFSLVKTKIIHYSSMSYLPLTFLSAYTLYQTLEGRMRWRRWQTGLLLGVGLLIALPVLLLPFVAMNLDAIAPLLQDPFARQTLQARVDWSVLQAAPGLLLLGTLILTVRRLKRKQYLPGFLLLLLGCTLFLSWLSLSIVPRVERYSQGAAIDFLKAHAHERAYYTTIGHKSYAPYFYGQLQRPTAAGYYAQQDSGHQHHKRYLDDWLLNSPEVDRPVYVIAKAKKKQNIADWYPHLQLLYEQNGFVFYLRPAP